MNSKKAITLLVLVTLLLSFVPVLPIKGAITDPEVWTVVAGVPGAMVDMTDVNVYDDTLTVVGTGVAPGQDIEAWWDGTTKLNTTDGNADGSFELWFDIPEALAGDHYVWVKVPSTGDFVKAMTAGIGSNGELLVGPSIDLDPSSGLAGEEVTISGYGFGDEVDITDIDWGLVDLSTSPSTPETNDVGSWSATFEVPDDLYAVYTVEATDGTNTADDDFEIGASIALDVTEGPSGTVVEISGRGFTAGTYINPGDGGSITYNGEDCTPVEGDDEEVKVRDNSDTTFVIEVVIPDTGLGEYPIIVTESGAAESAEADFEINGHPSVETDPEYGPVGSTVIVRGYNFTQIDGETVTLTLNLIGDTEVETDSNGEFETTFRIPGAPVTSTLDAKQTDYSIEADTEFRVGFITVVVNPQSGPAGTWLSLSGSGFATGGEDYNASIGGELWYEGGIDPVTGVISTTGHVPSLEAGIYEVLVTEISSMIQVSAEFEVTAPTMVETSPVVAPAGYTVTIMGYNFAENPAGNNDLEFVLYNDTDEWSIVPEYDMDPGWANTELLLDGDWDDGYFEGEFDLPGEDDLAVGIYYINVTDEYDLFYQLMFEVVDKTVEIEPKMPVFQVGDTCGFDIETSFKYEDSYIEVYDPEGNLYWTTDEFIWDVWVGVGTIERVPYYSQVAGGNPMTFLEDAPLGEWTWAWYDDGDDELDSGVFGLEPSDDSLLSDQVTDLSESISDLSGQVSDVTDDFTDLKSDIADVASVAADAVAAAEAASEAVTAVAATANTASEAASDAAEAANAAKDAANGLTTLVYGAIGAALVAALAAIVSLMQISRRIAG